MQYDILWNVFAGIPEVRGKSPKNAAINAGYNKTGLESGFFDIFLQGSARKQDNQREIQLMKAVYKLLPNLLHMVNWHLVHVTYMATLIWKCISYDIWPWVSTDSWDWKK